MGRLAWLVDRKQGITASAHLLSQDENVVDAFPIVPPPQDILTRQMIPLMRFVGTAHNVNAVASEEFALSVVAGNILRAMLNAMLTLVILETKQILNEMRENEVNTKRLFFKVLDNILIRGGRKYRLN
jgi:hypothetical protein